ncbi:MADF domain-containing protein [Caerostris darwini]|uniref:MADF domain-containing protein n=1 Tax=Caerostris darwini TaxID=1538125 RepID=A0AAV4PW73_9ARAC|nr:MADF domain-containing protein [Caerostris darwini]
MDWSNKECLRLINLYRSHESLWNPKDPYYYTKKKKQEAWEQIATEMNLDKTVIRSKMDSLLGSFRAQRSRCRQKTIAGTQTKYSSKWFAYDSLQFLLQKSFVSSDTNDSQDSEDVKLFECARSSPEPLVEQSDSNYESTVPLEHHNSFRCEIVNVQSIPVQNSVTEEQNKQRADRKIQRIDVNNFERKRKISDDFSEEEIDRNLQKNVKENKDDRLEIYGKYIAAKMKCYDKETELLVEHHINQILLFADSGCLKTKVRHLKLL